ncbi:hypothetical protein Ga0061061_1036 [Chelatococcus sambhunathii]|uniref:Secreted protein n=1 Tax=Chelatococcus sambhunathii TaxID=363953 RepID=A0ABP2A3V5_9HYPH|nr:hypothetical protein [Chelatococcus sambhunathii]CUA86758.1 hypothetical protein Ga0061061_1036 [Chelatococcus sambhunathii]
MRFSATTVPVRLCLAVLGLAATAGVAPAAEWTRGTVQGGQLSRHVTGDGLVYSGQTTRVGPNGGTYTSSATCLNGVVDRCRRSYTAIGPAGGTYSGERASARGPFRVRSVGRITGPDGGVAVGGHRRWR